MDDKRMNIAVCGYGDIWIEYAKALEKYKIDVRLLTVYDFNNGEHWVDESRTYLNINLLSKGILPKGYKVQGLDKRYLQEIDKYRTFFDLMFDRIELNANSPKINNFEKSYIISNLVDFFSYTIEKHNFDFVMFSDQPHNVFDMAFYIACIVSDTKTLLTRKELFHTLSISDRLFSISKELENSLKNRNQVIVDYKEIESHLKTLNSSDYKTIQPDYMKKQESEKDKGSLGYFLKKITFANLKCIIKHLLDKKQICSKKFFSKQEFTESYNRCSQAPYLFSMFESFYYKKKLSKEYMRYAKRFSNEELKKKTYVYLALHYQPEASSLPTGGVFVDQMNIIRLLCASIPADWALVVREHPSQLMGPLLGSGGRWNKFYRLTSKYDNVSFASMDTDQVELLNNAECIATISGAVGVEALARQKKVMVFGNAWYKSLKAVKQITSKDDIRELLESSKWPYKDNSEMIEEIFEVFGLNFKNIKEKNNDNLRSGYLAAPIFYANFIKSGSKVAQDEINIDTK